MKHATTAVRRIVSIMLVAAIAGPVAGWAQEYPSRPIRFVVGFPPAGVADLLARSLALKLSEAWSQQVIVDSRTGAGGMIAMQIAAKAAPDGYTLLMGSSTGFSITPAVRTKLPYDPIKDYTPITRVALTPVILTVHPSFPAKSLQELTQLAKSKPGMSYGSTGYGGAPHIAMELYKRVAGIEITHIPFKGGGEAIIALIGGHIQLSSGAVSTALPHLKAARMRALGVTSEKRLTAIPDVPTFAESGLQGFVVDQWYGVFAPPGISPAITRKLNAALVSALQGDSFKKEFSGQGVELVSSTPEALAAYVKSELVRWGKVLEDLGIQDQP